MQIVKYVLTVGDHDPVILPDNLSIAMDRLNQLVDRMAFQPWRRKALHQQIANMPRAGTLFMSDDHILIKIERKALVNQ